MRSIAVIVLLALAAFAATIQPLGVQAERPAANVPLSLRESNYRGANGEGSCVHASLVTLLRWQGQAELADWWRRTYEGGEYSFTTLPALHGSGIRFAFSASPDLNFLRWACDTRRGVAITVAGGRHMICLVHFGDEWSAVIDNNRTDRVAWVPTRVIVAEWLRSNHWAFTPVYSPAPPRPI